MAQLRDAVSCESEMRQEAANCLLSLVYRGGLNGFRRNVWGRGEIGLRSCVAYDAQCSHQLPRYQGIPHRVPFPWQRIQGIQGPARCSVSLYVRRLLFCDRVASCSCVSFVSLHVSAAPTRMRALFTSTLVFFAQGWALSGPTAPL